MATKRIEFTVSEETWERIETARGDVPRAAFIKRTIEDRLGHKGTTTAGADEFTQNGPTSPGSSASAP
jgi:hypothetical protein